MGRPTKTLKKMAEIFYKYYLKKKNFVWAAYKLASKDEEYIKLQDKLQKSGYYPDQWEMYKDIGVEFKKLKEGEENGKHI